VVGHLECSARCWPEQLIWSAEKSNLRWVTQPLAGSNNLSYEGRQLRTLRL